MTKLEELEAAWEAAYKAAWVANDRAWAAFGAAKGVTDDAWDVYADAKAAAVDAWGAADAAIDAYQAELDKIKEENSND